MAGEIDYGDLPIERPEQDLFGTDPFIRALARSIRGMKSPQGVVIALNGPWGSGKSSAINLLKHHLDRNGYDNDLEIVNFNPWWFRGEEALVLAFFRELYAATGPSIGEKARSLLPKLGARLLKAGGVVAPAADALGASGAGAIASGAMNWLSGLIEDGESVEKLHAQLTAALADIAKRFVVIIDDIDRLSPDEALAMFRLVKSVGRLPNVIYILAFDRLLAEKVVGERFPSEGPHYLEKIVQASFELPPPTPSDLQDVLISRIFEVAGGPDDRLIVHFMNLFHEIVSPEIATPRDVFRFINAFSVTWPAVAGDVDLGDFVALEAYRLFRPSIYQAIRSNQQMLLNSNHGGGRDKDAAARADAALLSSEADKERFRRGLMRLFPVMESVWSNVIHGGNERAARQRRACSPDHFQAYFRLTVSDEIVSKSDLDQLVSHAGDSAWISAALLSAAAARNRRGQSRVPAVLQSLQLHGSDIPLNQVASLLAGVFAVADQLDIEEDRARGFSVGNNSLRIHWLLRALLLERTNLEDRSRILLSAAHKAQLGWLVHLTSSAWWDHHPAEGEEPEPEETRLTTLIDADRLRAEALRRIRSAARDGSLITHSDLPSILFRWRDFADDGGTAVRRWTTSRLKEETSLVRFAAAFTSYSWGQAIGGFGGLGDLVAKRSVLAGVDGIDAILDVVEFRRRLERLERSLDDSSGDHKVVVTFMNAWRGREASRYS